MLKLKLFFILIALNSFHNIQASKRQLIDLEDYTHNEKLIFKKIEELPREMIIKISEYLEEKDFQSFGLTCKFCLDSIIFYPSLIYQSLDREKIAHDLEQTQFSDLKALSLEWSKIKKKSIYFRIYSIADTFSDHTMILDMSFCDYKRKMYNFQMTLKCLMMSFFLNPVNTQQKLIQLKEEKISGFYYNNRNLNDSPETLKLMITQGVIVSKNLLNNLDSHFSNSVRDIKLYSLNEQASFNYVTEFLSQFKAPIEDFV